MAASIVDDIPADAPASALREKLEAAIARAAAAESKLSGYEARDLLAEKGFDLVKPEDLADVKADQREAKAAEIQASRKELQEQLLRKALQATGLEGEALEDLVSQAAGQQAAAEADAAAAGRMRQVAQLPGTPVPPVNAEKLHGEDALNAAFAKPAKRS